ncbi:UDP-N-acetylglucosamine--N-acetylmuramyl-(pentapeptide) pyrophosphoryl-undecaprenol N-acetylglucosamine transferase [Ligilactobacillus salitolerans]|uniref:UDP-N-acetylglucosamine--N-acetylmuramyl-(pentapeptide) pyrophosphoryl-undecaprenol N-acetylglucosamine transferase n=1 Tax=Ligilactobacillus salitolerans TaxID=1808352 RepID=A0A401IQY2_9LACO|nr:undecaprenyldiphospho-muramoylpentapeptide beta-N-acetylglucosaminyltransferase [Ligilactobacillus salitolerans]GBG93947.1 UDP-N-acetylglucosamine--N-acetylmuramyl-(pentapeptide) pyrophosphoryl-undecaprenol N-acetylglucosamine transferase [Ligilactobacillus salitolerans]
MRLLISGGGTGGHIYPALALIEALKQKDPTAEVLYVGTKRGLESKIVPDAGIPFKTVEIQGFKRSLSLENFKTIYLFLKSVRDAKKIIKDFKPDVVVGTGGYVCGSVVYAAAKSKIPTMIHEQNSVSGVTNKFLSHYVDKIGICFPDVKKDFPAEKVVFTGNPRAQQVAGIQADNSLLQYGLKPTLPTLLIFGGSRGAEKINQTTLEAVPLFNDRPYQVLFVTGRAHYDKLIKQENAQNLPANVVIQPYIANMPQILPEVAAIVGRAGATSLAEITALGIPSILIPSPYVTNDHQTKNALSLVDSKAAELLPEAQLTSDQLYQRADKLMSDQQYRLQMAENAKKAGVPDAADQLLAVLEQISK